MRLNVTVPDELWLAAKARAPGVNVSGVLQAGLRALLGCAHDRAVCAACAEEVDLYELTQRSRRDLAWAVWLRLTDHVVAGGTAEGSARVLLDELGRQQVPEVDTWVLPRLSRAVRVERDEREAARARHPTAHRPATTLEGVA